MSDNVRTELREDGENFVLTKTIDDTPYRENTNELRKSLGKGFIRNEKGVSIGRRLLSIPLEEAAVLKVVEDPDWIEWWNTDSDKAFMRLIQRFPHWVAVEGGGLV